MKSCEQEARDLLERMGVDDAHLFSSGDVVELANLIANKPNKTETNMAIYLLEKFNFFHVIALIAVIEFITYILKNC